jgi:hypothetical protein
MKYVACPCPLHKGKMVEYRTAERHKKSMMQIALLTEARKRESQSSSSTSSSPDSLPLPLILHSSTPPSSSLSSSSSCSTPSFASTSSSSSSVVYKIYDRSDISVNEDNNQVDAHIDLPPPPPDEDELEIVEEDDDDLVNDHVNEILNIMGKHKMNQAAVTDWLNYINTQISPHLPENVRKQIPASFKELDKCIESSKSAYIIVMISFISRSLH